MAQSNNILHTERNSKLPLDISDHELINAFHLICTSSADSSDGFIRALSELFCNFLDRAIPNKLLSDTSINETKLAVVALDLMKQFAAVMSSISLKYNGQILSQLSSKLLPYCVIVQCLSFYHNLTDISDFEIAFRNLYKCNEIGDCLNRTNLKAIVDILKSRNANGNEEWTAIYGNATIFKRLVFYVK